MDIAYLHILLPQKQEVRLLVLFGYCLWGIVNSSRIKDSLDMLFKTFPRSTDSTVSDSLVKRSELRNVNLTILRYKR